MRVVDKKLGKAILQDLIVDEGLRLKPYRCTAGKLTIGIGRNLDDVGISEEEAIFMCERDISRCVVSAETIFKEFWYFSEERQRAIVNMIFNLGESRFKTFGKMIAAIRAKQWDQAALEAKSSKWYNQVGSRAVRIVKMLEGKKT